MAVERIGLTEIKTGYDMYRDCPYYAVFDSNDRTKSGVGDMLFPYKGNDRAGAGWQLLEENMNAANIQQPTTPFIIRFYEDLGKNDVINSNTPHSGCFKMRMNRVTDMAMGGMRQGGGMDMMNQLIQAKLDLLDQNYKHQLDDAQRQHDDELEELEEQKKSAGSNKDLGFIGVIGAAGEAHPWMQEPISQLLSVITNTLKDAATIFTHKLMDKTNARTQTAGIGRIPADAPPDKRMNEALKFLIAYNVKRFGWPEGATEEQMANASPEEKEAAHVRGFTHFSNTLVNLCTLCGDDDYYDLAIKKLTQHANGS